jgi:uncharacterized protein with HEPN domain
MYILKISDSVPEYILNNFNLSSNMIGEATSKISKNFVSNFNKKWNQSHRMKERFYEQHIE